MDKIYTRRKIKLPKTKKVKLKKIYFTVIMLVIIVITGYNVLNSVDPIFEELCIAKAQAIATDITNIKSSEVLAKYNYQDTVKIIKAEDGKSSIIKTDIVLINEIISDITVAIQQELKLLEEEVLEIPIGAIMGSQYFTASGPKMKIKIISAGEICTDIKTEFKSAGINQTIYRIYLSLECNVSILTSYKTINRKITNQVLLVETVIVGEVPETYLDVNNN